MPTPKAGRPHCGATKKVMGGGALLEQLVLLRPLPARNEYFAYGVAVAYIQASGESVDTSYQPWHDLITDIRALRLSVYDVADRLRSLPPPRKPGG
ncbi:hypothetical protein [Streptomyces alfalfae]